MINLKAKYTAEELIKSKLKLNKKHHVLCYMLCFFLIAAGIALGVFVILNFDNEILRYALVGAGALVGGGLGGLKVESKNTLSSRLRYVRKHNPDLLKGYSNEINIDRVESIFKVVAGDRSSVSKLNNDIFTKFLITDEYIYLFTGKTLNDILVVANTNKLEKDDFKALVKQFGDKVVDKRKKTKK